MNAIPVETGEKTIAPSEVHEGFFMDSDKQAEAKLEGEELVVEGQGKTRANKDGDGGQLVIPSGVAPEACEGGWLVDPFVSDDVAT